MKTTNFEISKKLAEIGFKANTDKCWAKITNSKGEVYNSCPFIDKIISFLDRTIDDANQIKEDIEKVRGINQALREKTEDSLIDKLKIVESYLNISFTGQYEKFFEREIIDISKKIEILEKENQELRDQIENLTK